MLIRFNVLINTVDKAILEAFSVLQVFIEADKMYFGFNHNIFQKWYLGEEMLFQGRLFFLLL